MNIEHVDNEAVRELRIIMGDEFGNLLQTFANDSTARIAAIQQAMTTADGEALRRAAHSFKGSSGNMGALRLSDLCRQIEDFARAGDIDSCMPLIAKLTDEFAIVQRELTSFTH